MISQDNPRQIYSKITSNMLYSLKGNLVTSSSLFLMNLFLARAFSPLDLSYIFIVISATGILMVLAEVGIPQAVTVEISKKIASQSLHQDVREIHSIILSSFSLGIIIAIFFVLGLFCVSDFIPLGQGTSFTFGILKISSLWIVFASFLKITHGVFGGFQEMKYSLYLNMVSEPLKFLVAVIAFYYGFYWEAVILGWTFTYLISSLFGLFLFLFFLDEKKIILNFAVPQRKKEILTQGLFLYSPVLGSFLIPYMMNLLLARYGVEEVSYFALSLSLTSIYFVFFNAFSFAFLPAATQLMAQEEKEHLANIVIMGTKYIGLGGVAILLVFYFFSDKILCLLYGSPYVRAEQVLQLLAFTIFFDIFRTIYDPLLMGTKHGGFVTAVEWIKFGMTFLVGALFIQKFGLVGAGVTLLVSLLTATILKVIFIQRYLSIKILKTMIGMGCLVTGLILYHFFKIHFIIILLIWAVTIYYFKLWVWREIKSILSLIRYAA